VGWHAVVPWRAMEERTERTQCSRRDRTEDERRKSLRFITLINIIAHTHTGDDMTKGSEGRRTRG